MKNIKKFVLFVAAFALLLMGCAQNEIVENRSEKNVIGFSNLNDRMTRAATDNDDNYGVFAVWSSNTTDLFMNNVKVWGKTADGNTIDTYSPLQYWPHAGSVDFYAYAPHNSANLKKSDGEVPDYKIDNLSAFYTVPAGTEDTDPVAQEDFTIATPVNVEIENGSPKVDDLKDGKVGLSFNHMLSKITIKMQLDNENDKLGDLGYWIHYGDASAAITVAHNQRGVDIKGSGDPIVFWGDLGSSSSTFTYENKFAADATGPNFLLIPQKTWGNYGEEANQSQVSIQLKGVRVYHGHYNPDFPESGLYWPTGEGKLDGADLAIFPFADGSLPGNQFEPGKHYVFTVTIGSSAGGADDKPVFGDKIEFSSSVANWDGQEGPNSNGDNHDDVVVIQPND